MTASTLTTEQLRTLRHMLGITDPSAREAKPEPRKPSFAEALETVLAEPQYDGQEICDGQRNSMTIPRQLSAQDWRRIVACARRASGE